MRDDEILDGHYEHDFQKAKNNGNYKLKKIKSRTRDVKRHLLLCWLGYNSDFDSWISAEDVHNV